MPLVDALLPEFDHEMSVTRTLLERVPEDRFDWKPHPKSFSLRDLAQHLATVPLWGLMTLDRTELDVAGVPPLPPVQDKDALLALFDGHVQRARAKLDGVSDAELMAPWTLKTGDQVAFTMPRASVWRTFVLSHLVHHRGQLTVYLRMQDVPLPAIYGPSADES